jgi:hypothetical protein
MAEGSQTHGESSGVMGRKVWTFLIRGGGAFHLKLERIGPALEHTGSDHTLWKMTGTEAEADSVQEVLEGPLVGATVQRFTEIETPEMLVIRNERLGRGV